MMGGKGGGRGGGGGREKQQKGVGGLKERALIRDREGVSGQTDRATWKPAVHTPAASEMGNISTPRPQCNIQHHRQALCSLS